MTNKTYEIGKFYFKIFLGFAKYSLEDIEKEGLTVMMHEYKSDITWRLRKFGNLSFSAAYKF